jgi:alpha/beta superfamily hydrolase
VALTTTSRTITTSDGIALEAEQRVPEGATAAAVLCHPHPQYGGNMFATLVAVLFDTLPTMGIATLRFNFRGVGDSGGEYADGIGEQLDAAAAVSALAADTGMRPWLCGWSFGADVALATDAPDAAGWIAVAAPLGLVPPSAMVAPTDPRPTFLLVPELDSFRPPDAAGAVTATWERPPALETIPGADHFLMGHSQVTAERIGAIILEAAAASSS